ncbi:MAG: hypothetical protein ACRD2L_01285 [Terriglobia bacterium]
MRKRRKEITVEVDEVFVIRQAGKKVRAWCAACGTDVVMVTPEAAAIVWGVSTRTIYAFVEARKIHFLETPADLLLVCTDSLLKYR